MGGLGAGLRTIHWDQTKLQPFEKNFYIEHPDVAARSEDDAVRWRRDHHITVNGSGIPKVRGGGVFVRPVGSRALARHR
jgi:ATP-dependent RNA helicase DDX5/DBP2